MIRLVNVQGLTKPKVVELEKLLMEKCELVCLTETQQKYKKVTFSKGINTVDSMRKSTDKKGGGLLMMYKESCMNLKKNAKQQH